MMLVFTGLFALTCCQKKDVPSTNTALKNLLVFTPNGGTNLVSFAVSTELYIVTLPTGTTQVFVKAIADDNGATITYSPEAGTDGNITLTEDNKVTITVTAPDTKTIKTYNISFKIPPPPPKDVASLKNLTVAITNGGTNLLTDFDASTELYPVTLPPLTTKVFLKVTASPSGAIVTYLPKAGSDDAITLLEDNQVTITVTATSNNTTKTYTINFTITPLTPVTDNTLKNLSVSSTEGGSNLINGFDALTESYKVTLSPKDTKVFVKCEPHAEEATVTYSPSGANSVYGIALTTIIDNKLTITVTSKDTQYIKVYTITLTIPKEGGGIDGGPVMILKTGKAAPFISKWVVATGGSITLPLVSNGEYSFSADWGDGSTNTITSWSQVTHPYRVAGEYTVKIEGTIVGWQFGDDDVNAKKIVEVSQWGNLFLGDTPGKQFRGTANLKITASDAPFLSDNKTKFTTDLHEAFSRATNLSGNFNNWDLSLVTNMQGMFSFTHSFNGDISGWNVSKVNNMENMFAFTDAFNQNIGGWDVSKVNNMQSMFYEAKVFNATIDNWDVSQVTNMENMFYNTPVFNADISRWNVSQVTNMKGMFYGTKVFNADISGWKTYNVTNMDNMFAYSEAFNADIGGWKVSKVTSMLFIFEFATAFNQYIGGWDISHINDMHRMFHGAKSFNQSLASWDVISVNNMESMFKDATSYNSNMSYWRVYSVRNMDYMFSGATSFNSDISGWNVFRVTSMEGMFSGATAFNSSIGGWSVNSVTNMKDMFRNATNFNQNLAGWIVSSATNMEGMFAGAEKFNHLIGLWNVSKVTNMASMFNGAKSFNQSLIDWNVSEVTDMSWMFAGAERFNQPIGKWVVSKVTSMESMFYEAKAFNADISGWNVSKVTTMFAMFNGATNFNQNLKPWGSNAARLTECTSIFSGSNVQDINKPTFPNCMP